MTDEIKEYKEEIQLLHAKIVNMKRDKATMNLKLALSKIDSKNLPDQYEIYRACIDYIAQHRHMFQNNGTARFITNKELKKRDSKKQNRRLD